MNKIDKIFTKLSIIIPVTLIFVHLFIELVYAALKFGSLITTGYLLVILFDLAIDISLSIIVVIALNFIKETMIYIQTKAFSLSYLVIIISSITSTLTIVCFCFFKFFVEAMINEILFICMISFLLLSLILLIAYFVKKKRS